MGNMPNNREVIELIHQDLPFLANSRPDAPDKKEASRSFGKMLGKFSTIEKHPLFVPTGEEMDDVRTLVQEASSIRTLIADIRKRIIVPFNGMLSDFIHEQGGQIQASVFTDLKFQMTMETHWERYQSVRSPAAERIRTENPGKTEDQLAMIAYIQVIWGGIHNVLYNDLAPLLCIPQVVQESENAIVEEKRWATIGDSTLQLMQDLSRSQDYVFIHGISEVMKDKNAAPVPRDAVDADVFDWPAYDSKAFRINEDTLALHPRIIRPTRKKLARLIRTNQIESDGERTGCPAFSTFETIHKRTMLVAQEAIFPYAEKILSLPSE